jgi:hypothetical protein
MDMGRISIAATLGWVVAFALGLAALVNASEFWAGGTLLLTLVLLFGSVLGAIIRGWRGGAWLGFAVFGWGYFLLPLTTWLAVDVRSLSDPAAAWAFERSNPPPSLPDSMVPQPPPPTPLVPPAAVPPPPTSSPGPMVGDLDADLVRPVLPPDFAAWQRRAERLELAKVIGHRLASLAFAGLGAILGVWLARGRPAGAGAAPVA